MASPDVNPGLQAPPGTYANLAAIEHGRLGNPYTKRWVAVTPDKEQPEDLDIIVRTDEHQERGPNWERRSGFRISPDGTVTNLEALRYRQVLNGERIPIDPPPSLTEILKEIQIAQRKQQKLKPRKWLRDLHRTSSS